MTLMFEFMEFSYYKKVYWYWFNLPYVWCPRCSMVSLKLTNVLDGNQCLWCPPMSFMPTTDVRMKVDFAMFCKVLKVSSTLHITFLNLQGYKKSLLSRQSFKTLQEAKQSKCRYLQPHKWLQLIHCKRYENNYLRCNDWLIC